MKLKFINTFKLLRYFYIHIIPHFYAEQQISKT